MRHRGKTAKERGQADPSDGDAKPASNAAESSMSNRTCVLVLGMHRSGTSALTRIFNLLGAELPKNMLGANPSNEAGHWEPARLIELHDRFLAEAGSRWSDWRALNLKNMPSARLDAYRSEITTVLTEDYGQSDIIVLKEPRICRFAAWFTKILRDQGFDVLVIFPFRNPLEVAASLLQRDGMTQNEATLLWLRSTLDAEYASREFPRSFVAYESVLANPRRVVSSMLDGLGIFNQNISEQTWKKIGEFISPDLRRQQYAINKLEMDPLTQSWILDLYKACQALQRNVSDESALKTFDRIRDAFEGAMPLLSALALDIPAVSRDDVKHISAHKKQEKTAKRQAVTQRAAAKKTLTKQSDEIDGVKSALSQAERPVRDHKKTTRRRLKGIEKIQADYDNKTRELDEARHQVKAQADEISRIKLALLQAERRAEDGERTVKRQVKDIEKVQADYDKRTRELDEARYRLGAIEAGTKSFAANAASSKKAPLRAIFDRLLGRADLETLLETKSSMPMSAQTGDTAQISMNDLEFSTPPLVSVIVPVKNGLPHFAAVMNMLGRQKLGAGFEVIVIDSGSTDGSLAAVPSYDSRFRTIEIQPSDFGHGTTRNLGVQEAKGEYCAFLTHDALPTDEHWLSALVKPLQADPEVAGVFGRHIAYPDASPYTRWELETHFEGLRKWPIVKLDDAREYVRNQGLRQVYHFYSDNSSCLRKSVWHEIPYPDVDFSEDQLWAKQIVEAGYKKAFAWDSVVYHSHDYSVWQRLKRSYDEARAFNRLFSYELCPSRKQAVIQALRVSARDIKLALRHGWVVKNPITTLVKPFDNLARQVGYYMGSSSWGTREERARLLSRDKALKAQ